MSAGASVIVPSPGSANVTRAAKSSAKANTGWLFGPRLDLLFVANLSWPILAIVSAQAAHQPLGEALGFLVAYFLIMPHRWITLALVFLDRKRLESNAKPFLLVAVSIVLGASLLQLSMGALTLLLAIDLLWNAWHFAAQHGGIARIYDRAARPDSQSSGRLDKYVLRTLVLFAVFRLTGTTLPSVAEGRAWLEWLTPIMTTLSVFDWLVIALPLVLLVREVTDFRKTAWGRIAYLVSVGSLYSLMIYAVRIDHVGLKIGCAAGATLFHSVEYLAIVSWYVKKNKSLHDTQPWSFCLPRWAVCLVAFMACCAVSALLLKVRFLYAWVFLNLIVSYMHYAFDGMIWKKPKKQSKPIAAPA